ncbi:hypothetical protein ES708_23020 [subsurface metagenome]
MLGKWLRKACKGKNLSLRQAGKMIGISHTTIALILHDRPVHPLTIRKLAKTFSNGKYHRAALEDELLTLAGYRSKPPPEVNETIARLIDGVRDFSPEEIKMLTRFADYLREIREPISALHNHL